LSWGVAVDWLRAIKAFNFIVMAKNAFQKRAGGLLSIALFLTISLSCQTMFKAKHSVAKFDDDHGRVIEIVADNFNDNGQGFYYQVTVNGNVEVQPSLIWFGDEDVDKPHFTIMKDGREELIGIAEEKTPNTILAIHDFSSGRSWPGKCFSDTPRQCYEKGLSLLENLQKEKPSIHLNLRGG
jgi:hypothetical protein